MWRTKSRKSRPYALTEWFDSSASQIQGTRAPATLAGPPLASRAWARKACDLVGGRGVAVEEVAALGDEGRAGRRQGREAGAVTVQYYWFQ